MRIMARIGLVWMICMTLASTAHAQQVSLDLGGQGSLTLRSIQIFALITVLSIAPGLAMMITCFPFIVTVFSILRQAIGLQQAPPAMMIVSLSLFLTYFVMEPTFNKAWTQGISPFIDGTIPPDQALPLVIGPFRKFMLARTDANVIHTLEAVRHIPATGSTGGSAKVALSVLLPSFMLSEIQRAFEVGFLIFLPFLVIDLVVAAVLMSMGMMMVPPAVVSLPFKLAFFVVSDGWSLLADALVRGYQ